MFTKWNFFFIIKLTHIFPTKSLSGVAPNRLRRMIHHIDIPVFKNTLFFTWWPVGEEKLLKI